MFLNILLACACIVVVGGSVLLLSPIVFRYQTDGQHLNEGSVCLHILHPIFIHITYSLADATVDIRLLHRFHVGSHRPGSPGEELSTPEPVPSDTVVDAIGAGTESVYERETQPQEETPARSVEEKEPLPLPAAATEELAGPSELPHQETALVSTPVREEYHHTVADKHKKSKVSEKKRKPKEKKQKEKLEAEKEGRSKWQTFKIWYTFVLAQKTIAHNVLSWLKRVIGSCFRIITFDVLSLDIEAGFSDPALTGTIHGFFTSLYHGLDLEANRTFSFNFQPVFENRDTFSAKGAVGCKTSLAQLLRPLAVALFTFPYFSLLVLWLRYRRFRKKK